MKTRYFLIGFACAILVSAGALGIGGFLWLTAGSSGTDRQPTEFANVGDASVLPDVEAHTKIFEKRTEEPVPGVHVAIGYGLANVVIIDAPDGLIMVDTLESIRAANGLLPWVDELRQSTGKDITDIVFTHNHADHVFGAGVFVDSQDTVPRIWAQEGTEHRVHEVINVLAPVIFQRSMRMFGTYLPDESFANNGIGPRLLNDDQDSIYFLTPTETIDDYAEVTMAGEQVVIAHAPGETADQLMMFLPERDVLLPADNYYHAFPNLYTIRGTPFRDPRDWVKSLDLMRSFNAEVMVPQHSQPVFGASEVEERLRNYRDAIQFVYDETIRMINKGLTPDEIAEQIELPPHLAQAPYLQEFYGRVEWAARGIFSGTLGWFSGDPADLLPVNKDREAELIVELAGGRDAVLRAARVALDTGEPAWTLTLATHLQRLGDDDAAALKADALLALASQETSSSGRNYFLTSAAETKGFALPEPGLSDTPDSVVSGIPIRNFLSSLTVNLKAEDHFDSEIAYGFDFTDAEAITVRIRRGVAFLEDGLAEDRIGAMITTADTFRGIAIGRLSPTRLLITGDVAVEGSIREFSTFMSHFAPAIATEQSSDN